MRRRSGSEQAHSSAARKHSAASIEHDPKLRDYHLLLAVRGQLLADVGRVNEAAECFRAALECACSEPERRLIARRLARVTPARQVRPYTA